MITAKQAKQISLKSSSLCKTLTAAHDVVKSLANLGFQNGSFHVPARKIKVFANALTSKGYMVFVHDSVPDEDGHILVELEWHNV